MLIEKIISNKSKYTFFFPFFIIITFYLFHLFNFAPFWPLNSDSLYKFYFINNSETFNIIEGGKNV